MIETTSPRQASTPRPLFSLLHATRRLPDGWWSAATMWLGRCDQKQRSIEYLLAVEPGSFIKRPDPAVGVRVVLNLGRPCPIDAYNVAARASTGHILVVIADDLFPPEHWDTQILNALGNDPSREAAVWMTTEHPHIMTHPCLTRTYYERPGRGGCGGELFHPVYASYGADDDYTAVAWRDGVVVKPNPPIVCEHKHWTNGLAEMDETYSHSAHLGGNKDEIFARRKAEGFK